MKKAISGKRTDWLFWLGMVILPAICFFLLLNADLPDSLIKLANRFKLIHFLGFTLLFYLLFQRNGRYARLLRCVLIALLFALPMAVNLSTGISNSTILGGFIPYKDGFYYYNGANMLLSGQRIGTNGLQGAFRPLFPGLLSILLLITGHNMLLSLALMVLAAAYCCTFAAEAMREEYGPLPAAVFFTLIYAFIRPMLGDTLTEIPSLTFACLALVLLFKTNRSGKVMDALTGGIMLVLALSIRAGAFFMLPFLVLWLGWRFRGEKKFSLRMFLIFAIVLLAVFFTVNTFFTRMVTEQGDSTFGNFSWMLYGQAVGGAGFKYHYEALGTDDSAVVMQAALDKIREYPLGLLIGTFKSYRDFFTNNSLGMFELLSGEHAAGGWIFWILMAGLLAWGIIHSMRNIKKSTNLLLLGGFVGVLLSIPFLPPIDGGNRFYSGSVPFLFALISAGLPALAFSKAKQEKHSFLQQMTNISRWLSVVFAVGLIVVPVLILNLSKAEEMVEMACEGDLVPFTLDYFQGTYVDLLPDEDISCGISPDLCLSRFAGNGTQKSNDEFYNKLVELGEASSQGVRVWAGIEWESGQYQFMVLPLELAEDTVSGQRFNGCAERIETQFQRILKVVSINSH